MSADFDLPEYLEFFDAILLTLDRAFRDLENLAPKPKAYVRGRAIEFRYAKRPPEAAIFLKLVRGISLVHALRALVAGGFIQEH
jgi:hypothetical protein